MSSSAIEKTKALLAKGEYNASSHMDSLLGLANEVIQEGLKDTTKIQEALNIRYIIHFKHTFQVKEGKLLISDSSLNRMNWFLSEQRSVIQQLTKVLLSDESIQDSDQALQVFAIAFTGYAEALRLLQLPVTSTYQLVEPEPVVTS